MESGAEGQDKLQLIFEEDSKIPEWQKNNRILSLSFQDKREFPPLQAADILAYELYQKSKRQFGQESRPDRHPLKELGSKKHQWIRMTEAHLREYDDDLTRQLVAWFVESK